MSPIHGESPACQGGRGHSSARDIGALFRRHGDEFRRSHALGAMERRALRDIAVCRTGALGGHRDVCANCGCEREVFNSCRNRHCPKCQALRQARWVSARMQQALPVRHFHVVFTLPAELRELVRLHEAPLLDLLFSAASETLLQLASDPKRLGGLLGVTAVVHTWGRNLIFHPHLHCIVTAGGLGLGHAWADSSEKYLLPVKVATRALPVVRQLLPSYSSTWRSIATAAELPGIVRSHGQRLLFAHAGSAQFTSRTRAFVQHVV